MEQTTSTEQKVMHLRVPADLHAKVAEFATWSHRSLNGAAAALLELGLVWTDENEAALRKGSK